MEMIQRAENVAKKLEILYVHRRKRSIEAVQKEVYEDCLVVGKERLELYPLGEIEPAFSIQTQLRFVLKDYKEVSAILLLRQRNLPMERNF